MKDPELDVLIKELETQNDLTVADFDGIAHGLAYLLPSSVVADEKQAANLSTMEEAMRIADHAFPDWTVQIGGHTNHKDGHWMCLLREIDNDDKEAAIGLGRSPVAAQALLAATLRLAMVLK